MPLLVCSELDLKAGARTTTLHLMSACCAARARGLPAADRGVLEASTSDPVARVTILSAGGGVMDVTETTVVRRCLNPIWNAAFSFEIQHGRKHTKMGKVRCYISP